MNHGVRFATFGSALLASVVALAQSGGGYTVRRQTVDGGGGPMTGANGIVLNGTIGQPDASPTPMVGANGYKVVGGFWVGAEPVARPDALFGNGFE